jgi:glyoxylase-like metal-dependent hydrolase (beta-lactamase superfamily II)
VVKKVPWLFPHFVTPAGKLSVSIHSLVVDTPGAKLVVDTCIGNGRNREPLAIMSNLSTSYLEDMIAAGYPPDSIDYVLCTHLHLDHVGWNTRLVNGKWVPTFPKASYLMDKKDIALYGSIDEHTQDAFMQMQRRTFADSVQPVFDAGLAKPVEGPAEVCEGVRLVPTPGHTPGHCSVLIASRGEKALITGDFMHHPIQFHNPGFSISADVDTNAAIATRRRVFAEYADTPTLIIGTHFAGPTAGKLVRDGDAYRLHV